MSHESVAIEAVPPLHPVPLRGAVSANPDLHPRLLEQLQQARLVSAGTSHDCNFKRLHRSYF